MKRAELSDEEREYYLERRTAVMNLRAVLATEQGRGILKYWFKNFQVGEFPPEGLDGQALSDFMGKLRAGQEFFELVSEASPTKAAQLLAELKKEKYEKFYQELTNG